MLKTSQIGMRKTQSGFFEHLRFAKEASKLSKGMFTDKITSLPPGVNTKKIWLILYSVLFLIQRKPKYMSLEVIIY